MRKVKSCKHITPWGQPMKFNDVLWMSTTNPTVFFGKWALYATTIYMCSTNIIIKYRKLFRSLVDTKGEGMGKDCPHWIPSSPFPRLPEINLTYTYDQTYSGFKMASSLLQYSIRWSNTHAKKVHPCLQNGRTPIGLTTKNPPLVSIMGVPNWSHYTKTFMQYNKML